jgi:hypothetical protein
VRQDAMVKLCVVRGLGRQGSGVRSVLPYNNMPTTTSTDQLELVFHKTDLTTYLLRGINIEVQFEPIYNLGNTTNRPDAFQVRYR